MLVVTSVVRKKGEVISVKLISGEEVFGRFVSQTEDKLVMSKVMKLVMTAEGHPAFASVLQTSEQEELEFNRDHLLLVASTQDQIKNDYLKATSTIKVPDQVSSIIHP